MIELSRVELTHGGVNYFLLIIFTKSYELLSLPDSSIFGLWGENLGK